MCDELVIEGVDKVRLALSELDQLDYAVVTVTAGQELHAKGRVELEERQQCGLIALFEEMARDWRGWEGGKEWKSTDGRLKLACFHDRLGHIDLAFELRSSGLADQLEWQLQSSLWVEAGTLDGLVRRVRAFFAL